MPGLLTHQRILADLTRYHDPELATLYDDLAYWYEGKEGFIPYDTLDLMGQLDMLPSPDAPHRARAVALFEDRLQILRSWAFWVPPAAAQAFVHPRTAPEDTPQRLVSIRDVTLSVGERGVVRTRAAIKVRSVPWAGLRDGQFFETHSGFRIPRVGA